MLTKIFSSTLYGIEARVIAVEVAYNPGLPAMHIVGLPDVAIRESRERIRGCLRNNKTIEYPIGRMVINLAPASLHKYGTQFDLAIAIGIASIKRRFIDQVNKTVFIGELSLDGSVRSVKGCLAMVIAAKAEGYSAVILPLENVSEVVWISGISIYPVNSLDDCLKFCTGSKIIPVEPNNYLTHNDKFNVSVIDFKYIQGLHFAKRGLEIAAAGGHNMLLSGSSGLGKTILAQALPGILPELNSAQFLETLAIHGIRNYGICSKQPPFRAPSPNITASAFIGGGALVQPGEITLAHNGVLFMDEFPEFSREIIESLRQPLESGQISLARSRENFIFPARFVLIAAQNLCYCGNYGDVHKECTCSALQISRYQKKISGPILDRIDIHIRLQRKDSRQYQEAEDSAAVLKRVETARNIQIARNPLGVLNGFVSWTVLQNIINCTQSAVELLNTADNKFAMSMRSKIKIIKIARTIADLAGSEQVSESHITEALSYRFAE